MESAGQKKTRKKLYEHILNLGGTKPRDFLSCALKEVMTDKLVCDFSWPGDSKSEKFGNTKISNVLFRAAQSCPLFKGPDTITEYKKEILEILRCTKQRYRNQIKKLAAPEIDDPERDEEQLDEDEESLNGDEESSDGDEESLDRDEQLDGENRDADSEGETEESLHKTI